MLHWKARLAALFERPRDQARRGPGPQARRQVQEFRPDRFQDYTVEVLEGRVVLSGWGGDLYEGLASVGIVGGVNFDIPAPPWGGPGGPGAWSGPNSHQGSHDADVSKLQSDLQALATKSNVTLADINNLYQDSQAISQAGFQFDPDSLHAATYQLATAVAGGGDTTQAQTDFAAQFSGSDVSQSVIDKTTTDVVQAIKASNITAADLADLAADQEAIDFELAGLTDGPEAGNGHDLANRLLSSLSNLGVATSARAASTANPPAGPGGAVDSRVAQLSTDVQKLQSDMQGLLAKSGVTVADLSNLESDALTIEKSAPGPLAQDLPQVVSELATAVASGADTTQAKADFQGLFDGANVPDSVLEKAFEDVIRTIEDSKISSSDLDLIAADRAAIASDSAGQDDGSSRAYGLPPVTTVVGGALNATGLAVADSGTSTSGGSTSSGSTSSSTSNSSSGRVGGGHRSRSFFRARHR
ncbi:hypothetical protein [Singulisphaera sp. PoT]|uniref:hypothetical protein n=1 Tax=Singulisphaera sp. PoT TaxID=3411797 RepID=UPI003BF4C477